MTKFPVQKFTFTYRKDKDNEVATYVTSAPIEDHPYHFIAYKYQRGESCGVRRFNKANVLTPIQAVK
jgi:hypothetical protein|tara:strand:+ start:560 stop:760 length:201 start_codon:yes stop_codon:yes gene_type:complete